MTAAQSRLMVMLSLAVAVTVLIWPPIGLIGAIAAGLAGLLILLGLRPGRRWGGWVAVAMIPVFCAAVMNLLAGPMARLPALLLCLASIVACLGGLDWVRRTGGSLRS